MATAGAAGHAVPPAVRGEALKRLKLAATLHFTAVVIFERRAGTRPLPHREGGSAEAQLQNQEPLHARRGREPRLPNLLEEHGDTLDEPPPSDDEEDEDPFQLGFSLD